MSKPIARDVVPSVASPFRFQWEEAQQSFVLLYPEGMVKLNAAAGEILKRCDGERTVAEIIGNLESEFPDSDVEPDVLDFLAEARDKRWIRI